MAPVTCKTKSLPSLNLTVAGIVGHQSALKNGEPMKIPQYKM
jgi:hypothetical protein